MEWKFLQKQTQGLKIKETEEDLRQKREKEDEKKARLNIVIGNITRRLAEIDEELASIKIRPEATDTDSEKVRQLFKKLNLARAKLEEITKSRLGRILSGTINKLKQTIHESEEAIEYERRKDQTKTKTKTKIQSRMINEDGEDALLREQDNLRQKLQDTKKELGGIKKDDKIEIPPVSSTTPEITQTKPHMELIIKKETIEPPKDVQTEKAIALAKLRETISTATKRLVEIETELTAIRARKASKKVSPEIKEAPKPTTETLEIENFSTDQVRDIIKKLLAFQKVGDIKTESVEGDSVKVKEIKNFEIKGNGNEITLSAKVNTEIKIPGTEKLVTKDVGINATLESRNGFIIVKNYKINANANVLNPILNPLLGLIIKPHLEKISETIKSYIEKERKGKKVESIEIENGQLKVTFKKVS